MNETQKALACFYYLPEFSKQNFGFSHEEAILFLKSQNEPISSLLYTFQQNNLPQETIDKYLKLFNS